MSTINVEYSCNEDQRWARVFLCRAIAFYDFRKVFRALHYSIYCRTVLFKKILKITQKCEKEQVPILGHQIYK